MAVQWAKLLGALAWLLAAAPIYLLLINLIYDHLGSDKDGLRFLGPSALWLDTALKIFFFFTVWQAIMDFLVLAQEGSNVEARKSLMLGHEHYADLYFYFTQREDSLFPSLASGGKMDAQELVDTVMKDRLARILQVIGLLARVALTTGGMVLNLRALPERHPALPLNQAKYYVVYFEIIILGLYWAMLIYRLGQWATGRKLAYIGAVLADAARDIAGWSSMQLLRNLSMARMTDRVTRVMTECEYFFAPSMQYVMGLVEASGYILAGGCGVLVLAVKATQIDFVTVHLMSKYTVGEWIRLMSFTVSMVNIFDLETEKIRAVQELLITHYELVVTGMQWPPPMFVAWERKLASRVAEKEGFWTSFLLMATLSYKDYKKFLNLEDMDRCPALLQDLVTEHPLVEERCLHAKQLGLKPQEVDRLKRWVLADPGPKAFFRSSYAKLAAP